MSGPSYSSKFSKFSVKSQLVITAQEVMIAKQDDQIAMMKKMLVNAGIRGMVKEKAEMKRTLIEVGLVPAVSAVSVTVQYARHARYNLYVWAAKAAKAAKAVNVKSYLKGCNTSPFVQT